MAPEDAFQLALERPGSDESTSELVALAVHLRAIGVEIQAPDGLRARRGALLALGSARGVARRPLLGFVLGWRRARALLVAAVLTMLTVVGVAAATLADRLLDVTGDENGAVPLIVPSPRESDDERTDGSAIEPSPTFVVDGLTNAGSDDEDGARHDEGDGDELDDPEDVDDVDDDRTDGSEADDEDGADDDTDDQTTELGDETDAADGNEGSGDDELSDDADDAATTEFDDSGDGDPEASGGAEDAVDVGDESE